MEAKNVLQKTINEFNEEEGLNVSLEDFNWNGTEYLIKGYIFDDIVSRVINHSKVDISRVFDNNGPTGHIEASCLANVSGIGEKSVILENIHFDNRMGLNELLQWIEKMLGMVDVISK